MKEKDKEVFEENKEILDADFEKVEESDTDQPTEEAYEKKEEVLEEVDEKEEYKNQLIRLQADFSNYKKRVEKEKEDYIDLGVKKLALEILPVIDNLERALDSISQYAKDEEIFKGISLIDDQFLEVLSKNKITEIEAQGQKFDPSQHHAVAVVDSEDGQEDIVIDVLQKGYQIKDQVLRPAMVRVSK